MTALARNTDPATSHTAASMAGGLVSYHHELIVDALNKEPMGCDLIAWTIGGISGHQVGKRMNELLKAGRVELTGQTVTSFSGRPQREWRAVKAKTLHSAN